MVHPFPFSVICAVGFYTAVAAAADNDSARSTCTICVTKRMGTQHKTQTRKNCRRLQNRVRVVYCEKAARRARACWPLTMFKWEKMYDVCLVYTYNENALRWIHTHTHTKLLVRIFVLLKQRTRSTHVCKRKRTIAFESDDASGRSHVASTTTTTTTAAAYSFYYIARRRRILQKVRTLSSTEP